MNTKKAVIAGAGIAGLAMARALALKGFAVTVIEKNTRAVDASIRNFGMVWPIGQPEGRLYETALQSRSIWQQIAGSGVCWHEAAGSLHLAYDALEWEVLKELYEAFADKRPVQLLAPDAVQQYSPGANARGLHGALYSSSELIVDAREAIAALPVYLQESFGVQFVWGKNISFAGDNMVYAGDVETWDADIMVVCSGADFETLFPEVFAAIPITKCRLQMLRMGPQPDGWRMGAALCGGLSLAHYRSFEAAASLPALKRRYETEMAAYMGKGIHVMAAQNGRGEITIGDSHAYGPVHDPFDDAEINRLILDYLGRMARFPNNTITSTWHGIYPKLTNGEPYCFLNPRPDVYIFNGLGGAGMTLAFGLAEQLVEGL